MSDSHNPQQNPAAKPSASADPTDNGSQMATPSDAAASLSAQAAALGVPSDASPEEMEAAIAASAAEADAEPDALAIAMAEAATLKAKVTDLQDQYLRGQAAVQNARRRADEEISKARKFAVEGFAEAMLPVLDSLEAGLQVTDAAPEQLREGAAATLRQLKSALERNKVIEINPAPTDGGPAKFDPTRHQAISMVPAEQDAGTVVAVLQKGYSINDRTLRPALVTVAAAK